MVEFLLLVTLICVTMNGHHNESTSYQWVWEKESEELQLHQEKFPVIYVVQEGRYRCKVQTDTHSETLIFSVTSEFCATIHGHMHVLCMYPFQKNKESLW